MLAKYIVFLAFILIAVSLSSADGKLEYCVEFFIEKNVDTFLTNWREFLIFLLHLWKNLGFKS